MRRCVSHPAQRGAALIVGLVMLVLITLLVTSAFMLSNTNLKSVGNMQSRDEAVAAANAAIEQIISSPFTAAPTAESINVDLNNDGTTDYTVNFATPVCVASNTLSGTTVPPSSDQLAGQAITSSTPNYYNTIWDLDATVTDNISGTSIEVHEGVRVLLSQTQHAQVCP